MKIQNKLLYREYINREENFLRATYQPELDFYNAIKNGDIKKVRSFNKETLAEKSGLGTLSSNSLQNIKYHFVITAALIARYCIEGGLDLHTAYALSDYYILSADESTTIEEVSALHIKMCNDYTERMAKLHTQSICSKPIADCIDYIYDHLHTRITLQTLAEHVQLSPAYLSRLFKKETSLSVSEYIQSKKIETAKSMLQYSDLSISEIASTLAFPSQSYFTEVFEKHTAATPLQYRKLNYNKIDVE